MMLKIKINLLVLLFPLFLFSQSKVIVKIKPGHEKAQIVKDLVPFSKNLVNPKHEKINRQALFDRHEKYFSGWLIIETNNSDSLVKSLLKNPNVDTAYQETVYKLDFSPNDPDFTDAKQWYLNNDGTVGYTTGTPGVDINIEQAWNITTGDSTVLIGYVDSGANIELSDISSSLYDAYDFYLHTATITPENHATGTIGITCSKTNDNCGIAGIVGGNSSQGCKFALAVAGNESGLYSTSIASGIVWLTDLGCSVINMSFGSTAENSLIKIALQYAYNSKINNKTRKGVVLVSSAGNDKLYFSRTYPASYSFVLGVTGTDNKDSVYAVGSNGTNYGWYDIAAPAEYIYTLNAYLGDCGTYYTNGTSYGSPMVAGVAAMILSVYPNSFTNDEIYSILEDSADPNIYNIVDPIYIGKLGSGRVDAYAALKLAKKRHLAKLIATF